MQDDTNDKPVILDPPTDPGDLSNPPGTGADDDDFIEDVDDDEVLEEIEEDEDA